MLNFLPVYAEEAVALPSQIGIVQNVKYTDYYLFYKDVQYKIVAVRDYFIDLKRL